jgi:hypothetical protein
MVMRKLEGRFCGSLLPISRILWGNVNPQTGSSMMASLIRQFQLARVLNPP